MRTDASGDTRDDAVVILCVSSCALGIPGGTSRVAHGRFDTAGDCPDRAGVRTHSAKTPAPEKGNRVRRVAGSGSGVGIVLVAFRRDRCAEAAVARLRRCGRARTVGGIGFCSRLVVDKPGTQGTGRNRNCRRHPAVHADRVSASGATGRTSCDEKSPAAPRPSLEAVACIRRRVPWFALGDPLGWLDARHGGVSRSQGTAVLGNVRRDRHGCSTPNRVLCGDG